MSISYDPVVSLLLEVLQQAPVDSEISVIKKDRYFEFQVQWQAAERNGWLTSHSRKQQEAR